MAMDLARSIIAEIPRQGTPLSPRALALLIALEHGPRHFHELQAAFGFSVATMHEATVEVRSLGVVETHKDPADKRMLVLTLTAKGLRLRKLRRGRTDEVSK